MAQVLVLERPTRHMRALQRFSAVVLMFGACGCASSYDRGGPASPSPRSVVSPPGITPLVPAYSVGVRAGDFVFVSGLTGFVPGTEEIIAGGVTAQTRQALENIRTVLAASGARMADVVECTVFLRDIADFGAMNGVYREFFPTEPPARATVAVAALPRPAALVEIKCSARVQP